MSEGTYVNVRPYTPVKKGPKDVDETSDTYDTIDWLLKHVSGHNGKVGMTGISYPGFYTVTGMIDAHPALKAVSPQAPVTDWFIGDDWHHNGALFLAHNFNFLALFDRPRPHPTKKFNANFDHETPDGYSYFLKLGPLSAVSDRLFKGETAFFKEVTQHGTYDDFWKARNFRPHLKNIKPAVMTVGGWFDAENLFGALEVYKTLEKTSPKTTNRLVMGPWVHGGWGAAIRHARRRLEAGGRSFQLENGRLLSRGDRTSRSSSTFSKANAAMSSRRPGSSKRERTSGGSSRPGRPRTPSPNRSIFNPRVDSPMRSRRPPQARKKPLPSRGRLRPVSERSGPARPLYGRRDDRHGQGIHDGRPAFCLTPPRRARLYDPRFGGRLTIAGGIKVDLVVSTTGTDSDWIVKVIDVYPDDYPDPTPNPQKVRMGGYQQLVRGDVMRGKFRNSFEKPEPFVPQKPTPVKFTTQDVFHTFRSGHRMMVQVQSTWFPLVDRNPQVFTDIYSAKRRITTRRPSAFIARASCLRTSPCSRFPDAVTPGNRRPSPVAACRGRANGRGLWRPARKWGPFPP